MLGPRRTDPSEEKTMRTFTISTIAAALTVATAPAQAGTLGLGPDQGVSGAWSGSPQTIAYPIHLPAVGIAVRVTATWCATIDLVDRRGHVVQRVSYSPYDEGLGGGEMLVPAAGDYRVRATGVRCGIGLPARGTFDLALLRDCLGDARTLCALAPGETQNGTRAFTGDKDWRRLDLQAGRSYDLWSQGAASSVTLLDAQGRDVADSVQQPANCTGDECRYVIDGFVPPASGTYFAAVDANVDYAVTLVAH
jgi:hypothetical protein